MNFCQTSCYSSSCLTEPGLLAEPSGAELKLAIGLAVFTVVYTLLEGSTSLWLGLGAKSITLESFGLDSLLEVSAAMLLLWRLSLQSKGAKDDVVEASEGRVHRFVGGSFLLLALYVLWGSVTSLMAIEAPQPTQVGLLITALSVVIMPVLASVKLKVAARIGSEAMKMEAKETLACGILSTIALAGLGLNVGFGWWWADPVAGLCMLPWLVKEGWASVRGVSCCG